MFVLFGTLAILVAILLILVVVIQNSKGGGLSSTFGGASSATQLLGSRRSNEAIEKITWYLAGGLALIAFLANISGSSGINNGNDPLMRQAIEANQIMQNPTAVPDVENLGTPEGGDAATEGE